QCPNLLAFASAAFGARMQWSVVVLSHCYQTRTAPEQTSIPDVPRYEETRDCLSPLPLPLRESSAFLYSPDQCLAFEAVLTRFSPRSRAMPIVYSYRRSGERKQNEERGASS